MMQLHTRQSSMTLRAATSLTGAVSPVRCSAGSSQRLLLVVAPHVQARTKHYISYRLNDESYDVDPYVHLRSRSRQRRRNRSRVMVTVDVDLPTDQPEHAIDSTSTSMTNLLSPTAINRSNSVDVMKGEEEATLRRDKANDLMSVGMGMGTAGGLVQRSKGESLVTRGRPRKNGAGSSQEEPSRKGKLFTPAVIENELADGQSSSNGRSKNDDSGVQDMKPIDSGLEAWEQTIKNTGKKVLEKVEGAAAVVTHKAKEVWGSTSETASQEHGHHEHHGVVDTIKDVGKKTATAVDIGYDKTVGKAVDKMLEALDVSLARARARGYPPGLVVTSIVSIMGAQLMVAYTTKEEDTRSRIGRKIEHQPEQDQQQQQASSTRGRRKTNDKSNETKRRQKPTSVTNVVGHQ